MSLYIFCRSSCGVLHVRAYGFVRTQQSKYNFANAICNSSILCDSQQSIVLYNVIIKNETVQQTKKNVLFPFRRYSFFYVTWKKNSPCGKGNKKVISEFLYKSIFKFISVCTDNVVWMFSNSVSFNYNKYSYNKYS